MSRNAHNIKEEARDLIDRLPDDVTWDDVVYEFAVRRAIERGIADADSGRLLSIKDVQKEFEDKWMSDSRKRREDSSSISSHLSRKTPRRTQRP